MHPFPGEPAAPRREPGLLDGIAAALVLGAGVLHLLVVNEHFQHARGAGLFFLAVGVAQVGWSLAYARSPTPLLRRLGLGALVAAPLILYVLTRVWRAPWHDGPEAVDAIGIAVVALQLAAGVLLLWRPPRDSPKTAATAVLVGLLVGVAGYAGALGGEQVDWLSAADAGVAHAAGHGDGAHGGAEGDDHAGHGGAAWSVLFAGTRGTASVGNLSYYGPTTGDGIISTCATTGHPGQDCWLSYLQHYLASAGAVPAFQALVEITNLDNGAKSNAHPLAHQLGFQAYHAYGLDIAMAMRECSYELFQGCHHGALQSYFQDLAALGEPLDAETLQAACATREGSFAAYVCQHGMGHGVLMHTGYQLDEALDLCALLGTWAARENCYGGVHMENVVGYLDSQRPGHVPHDHGGGPPTYWVNATDLTYPCSDIAYDYRDSCWVMQTSLVLHFTGGDFVRLAQLCDEEAGPHRLRCHNGVGREAAAWANYDPAGMSQRCTYAAADAEEVCVKAFTAGTILQFNSPQRGVDVCVALPEHQQAWCYYETGRFAQSMTGDPGADALCAAVPEAYRTPCTEGRSG